MKFKKKSQIIAGVLFVAFMAFFLIGCQKAEAANKIGKNDYDVNGIYNIAIPSGGGNATILGFSFDKANGSYVESITLGEESYHLFEGTYRVEESKDLVICTPTKGEEQRFIIAGKYLIADGFFYDGQIPEEDTFDLMCVYENSAGGSSLLAFSKNGTYMESGGTTSSSGTYTRDGDFIHRTTDGGTELADFIIYKGQISNAFYIKQ